MGIGNIKYIAVVGVDGCGKSTWFNELVIYVGKNNKVVGIGDRVFFTNNNLNKKIERKIIFKIWQFFWRITKKTKNKFFYKIIKIIELILRIRTLKTAIKYYPVDFIISDGAPLINILAWGSIYYPKIFTDKLCVMAFQHLSGRRKVGISEYIYYFKKTPEIFLLNILGIRFPIPDILFFLEISPEEAVRRIKLRGKNLQFHENVEKLNQLQEGYFRVIKILEEKLKIKIIHQVVDNLDISDNIKIIKSNFNS